MILVPIHVELKFACQNPLLLHGSEQRKMEKPKARPVALDVKTVTYFGDWIVNFEKTIQALAHKQSTSMPKVASTQTPQVQLHGNR